MTDQACTPLHIDARVMISCDPRLLGAIRHTIEHLAGALGWDESEAHAITLAVEEALTNKIRHAYGNSPGGRILFEFRTETDALVFRLTDRGDPPDPAKICARDPGSLQSGGFGTHIIRDVMDKVVYATTAEGNHVTMTKYLPRSNRVAGGPA